MIAEELFAIALYLTVKEKERLYKMIGENLRNSLFHNTKKKMIIDEIEIINFLIKRCFSKVKK